MDDFKENNGLEPVPEEETVSGGDVPAEETAENNIQPEEIQETEVNEEDGILITPQDDSGEEAADEEEMCILCGEKPADKSFGENYDLCADCRKSLIKSPMRFSGFLAILVLFCAGVWGLLFAANQANTLMGVLEGDEFAAQNRLYTAISSYSSSGNIGWKTAKNMINAYNKSGYLSGINSTVSTYFYDATSLEEGDTLTFAEKAGKADLNAPWNKDVKKIYTDYNDAMAAYQKYYAFIAEYDEQLYYGSIKAEDIPYDEVNAKYNAAMNDAEADIDRAFVRYCQYYLAYMCNKELSVQHGYLAEVAEIAPECGWLYLTPLTEMNVMLGNYEEALEGCDALEAANADDLYGEYYRAQAFRRQGDYTEALKKCEAMIADYANNQFYYAYYEAAITAFLMGDYDKALEYSEACYGGGTSGVYLNEQTVNFHALVCKKLGDEEGYKAVVEFLKGYEMEISPTVEQYLNGEVTAEEIFNEREAAFE